MGNNLVQNLTKISRVLSNQITKTRLQNQFFYITDHDVGCEENLWIFVLRGLVILRLTSCKIKESFNF